jgi:hypothetical protein
MDTLTAKRPTPAAMVGNKVPMPHRFFLADGRIVRGDLYRGRQSRLADHMTTLKGYIGVVNAVIEGTEESLGFVTLTAAQVVMIEELPCWDSEER